MKKFLLITCLFVSSFLIADDHETSEKSSTDRFTNNPNYLLSFKECKETKDGVAGLLALSESVWKEIEANPENDEKWMEVAILADMAANYSEIYDVWCKDMIAQRMKMRMMAEKKKKLMKDKKD
tara:strand:- start:9079 stop:9450 length:372 start_codon:yes stop_codon:yes gene_type:complete